MGCCQSLPLGAPEFVTMKSPTSARYGSSFFDLEMSSENEANKHTPLKTRSTAGLETAFLTDRFEAPHSQRASSFALAPSQLVTIR